MDPIQAVQYRWQDLGKIHVYEMKRNPFTKAVQPFPHFSSGRLTLILFLLRSIKDHSRPADIKRHFVMDFFSPLIYLAVQWLNVASSMTFHQCSFHSQKQTGVCLTQSFTHSCQQARVAQKTICCLRYNKITMSYMDILENWLSFASDFSLCITNICFTLKFSEIRIILP